MKQLFILIVGVVLAIGAVCHAELITIEISGNITSAGGSGLPGTIHAGDIFTGIYTYDSLTLDSDAEPNRGYYQHSSPYGFRIFLGGYEFKTAADNGFAMRIWNNFTNPLGRSYDWYRVESIGVVPLPDIEYYQFHWDLENNTQNALSSEDLPITAPILNDWDRNSFQISSGNSFLIDGTVTQAEIIPEPLSITLFGLGGLFLRVQS